MTHSSAFKSFVEKALELDLFFAVFREPGKNQLTFISQQNETIKAFNSSTSLDFRGFVIAPFKGSKACVIQPDILINSLDEQLPELKAIQYIQTKSQPIPQVIDKTDYFKNLNALIQDLKDDKADKVVYSRIKEIKGFENYFDALKELEKPNSDAFVYLLNLPGKNTWLGASPEILLKNEDGLVKTMALASTRRTGKAKIVWNQKELDEHQFVADYIGLKLSENHVEWESGKTYNKELRSGITHLCTEFKMKLNTQNILPLAYQLHPTPAIAGIPLNQATELISKYELHDRELYTGFLGPINLNGRTAFYVNLRCARLTTEKSYLFLGGGITKESDSNDEWDETELKAQTILKVTQTPHKIKIFDA